MSEKKLSKFEVVKFGSYRFIGKSVYARAVLDLDEYLYTSKIFGGLWEQRDRIFKAIDELKEYATDEVNNVGLYTWEKFDDKNQLQGYTIGRFMKADTPVPNKLDYIDIPEIYVAKGSLSGEVDIVNEWTEGEYIFSVDGESLVKDEVERQGIYDAASWIFLAEVYPELPDNGKILSWEYYVPCNLKNPQS